MDIEIGQRLAARRRAHGLSQKELAATLGLSRQAISNWERAETAPDTDNLIALARFYAVSLDELLLLDEIPGSAGTATEQLTAQADGPGSKADEPQRGAGVPAHRGVSALIFALTAGLCYLFYFGAAPSLFVTITNEYGMMLNHEDLALWLLVVFASEAALVLLPYLVVAFAAKHAPWVERWVWFAPAFAYFVPIVAVWSFMLVTGTATGRSYEGAGIESGYLQPGVLLSVDVLSALIGCLGVSFVARRPKPEQLSASTADA